MDPAYMHHHSRYAPISSSPNPNFYGTHVYHHQNHLSTQPPHQLPPPSAPPLRPPAPPPPPQQQQQQLYHHHHHYRLPAPPPPPKSPYNPHHPQYVFNPNSPNHKPTNYTHHHHLQQQQQQQRSNDLPQRIHIDDDRHPHHQHHHRHPPLPEFETRPGSWDQSRIIPDNRPVISNQDYHHHQPEQQRQVSSPYRPTDKLRHDLDANYRFRERQVSDGFEFERSNSNSNQRSEFVQRRSHFVPDSDRLNIGSYDGPRGSEFGNNEVMRSNARDEVYDRQVLREKIHDSMVEMGSNNEDMGDGGRSFSGTRESYVSDSARYGDSRGSREDIYDYNRTPRKQVQKKSALLRIQKPCYRNRDDDSYQKRNWDDETYQKRNRDDESYQKRSRDDESYQKRNRDDESYQKRNRDDELYSSYFDEIMSASFRGKDQAVYSDRGLGEKEVKEREGSPMELDVSFKSNSLVAKAIVAPTNSTVVSDTNSTPKTRKMNRMNKLYESSMKSDSSRDVNDASCSDSKNSKQSERKVARSGIADIHDSNSQPCSSGTNGSPAKITPEISKGSVSDKGSTGFGTSKKVTLKFAKKKAAKKIVKVINTNPLVSSLQPSEKVDEPVIADVSSLFAPAAHVLKQGVKPLKEVTIVPENDKVDGSPQAAMIFEEAGTDVDSGGSCVTRSKQKISHLASSSHKETKIDEGCTSADNPFLVLDTASDIDKDLTKSLNETNAFDVSSVEGASKQDCHNGGSLLLGNSATKESPESLLPVDGDNSYRLSSEENKRHESMVNTCRFSHGHTATSFDTDLVSSKVNIIVSDIDVANVSNKQPCRSVDRSIVEGFPRVILPVRSSDISASSTAEAAENHDVSTYADCSNHERHSISGSDKVCINWENINLGNGDHIGKQLSSLDGVTISLEKDAKGENGKHMPNTNKSDVSLLNLAGAAVTDRYMGPVKAVGSAQTVDTTLSLSAKVSSPAEVSVLHRINSAGGLPDVKVSVGSGFIGTSPGKRKRRKVSACHHGSTSPVISETSESNSTGGLPDTKVSDGGGLIGTSPEKRKRRKVSACHPGSTSSMISEISERITSDPSLSGVEMPSNLYVDLIQPEEEVRVSNMNTLCNASSSPCPEEITILLESSSAQATSDVAVSVSRDAFRVRNDSLKIDHPRADSCSVFGETDIPNAPSSCQPGFGGGPVATVSPVMDGNNHKNKVKSMESEKEEKMDTVSAEERVMTSSETSQFKTPSELESPDFNQISHATDMKSDGFLLEKNDLPSVSTYLALGAAGDGVSTTNSIDGMMELDTLSDIASPEIFPGVPVMQTSNRVASPSLISDKKVCRDDKMPNEKPLIGGNFNLSAHTSPSQYAKINSKLDYALENAHLVAGRTGTLAQNVKSTRNLSSMSGETNAKKCQPSNVVSRIHPSHSPVAFTSKNAASSTRTTNPRTWIRPDNSAASSVPGNTPSSRTVPPQSQLPKKVAKFQNMSYVRKGNSLVRNPAPVAALPQASNGLTSSVHRLNSPGIGDLKKTTGVNSRSDVIDPPNLLRTKGMLAPFERPKTPPLPSITKVPNRATGSLGDCTSSPVAEPLPNGCSDTISDTQKLTESNDVPKSCNGALKISEIPLNQTSSVNSLESQGELNDGTLPASEMMSITYVKRKSNQLVAASNQCVQAAQKADKTKSFTSDGYYKRRKNQLIRTSSESHMNDMVTSTDSALISKGTTARKGIFTRSFSKRRSYKVVTNIRKPSRFSLVWTLSNMQSSKNDNQSSYRQKVIPYLFPWKRAGYMRSFVQNSVSISNSSSLSAISRKLLLLRKRDTVYTRSSHGFSLRKSKVLSVGGSSLKWSKSIETSSKKANEEATLAVAAVERKKKEQIGAESFTSVSKNRNHSSRERIFRICSVRYKMDPSRRTLQRISDDETSCSASLSSEKNSKKSYIPRRLVIGNDEYVQIGNGNKLIRDPKKRTRALASEKVRWSLHTARLRLARKRMYCQFFTRFGKCNKDNGKCPYIHDSSKIAVCTKFLNGSCSNSNCKLTHKVIPERMQDCSYFLQGLCSNKNCPYRHVHVNPEASTCEGFLKGYCADGDECRKKHSYVCPIFEATGSCPLGSKCKLHHPKGRSKGKKSKRSKEQKNSRGRYFGSMPVENSEPRIMVPERLSMQDNGDVSSGGNFAEYICLDASDEEEARETTNDAMKGQTTFHDTDASDFEIDDLDELIKPLRIMDRS